MGGHSDEKTRAFPNLKLEELISLGSGICSIFWDCSRVIKNRVYSAFWGFAMYVCTGSVRTYIAKRRNPLIYRILAVPVLGTAKLTARFGMKAKASVIRRPLSGRVRMSCFTTSI